MNNNNLLYELGWDLLEQRGLKGFTFENISFQSAVGFVHLVDQFKSPAHLFSKMIEELLADVPRHASPMYSSLNESEIQDLLFDQIMCYLEALDTRKVLLKSIYMDLLCKPSFVKVMKDLGTKYTHIILKQSGFQLGQFSYLQIPLAAALGLKIIYSWLHDESPDQAKTMAEVDKCAKQFLDLSQGRLPDINFLHTFLQKIF